VLRLPFRTEPRSTNCCYYVESEMTATPKPRNSAADAATQLAQRLSESLLRERLVPRFVDSYVVEHGRYGLQVHATLYRDLLALIQREALLASSARALDIATKGSNPSETSKSRPMTRKDALVFRRKFLAALTRHHHWNAGEALEFQSDLVMYEEILARAGTSQRRRKPFEVANHPFVDRCGFVLDSSFMEKARIAASRALADIEALAMQLTLDLLSDSSSR
jgi:hypothetical protein